jgi:FkbM family methyltransferase
MIYNIAVFKIIIKRIFIYFNLYFFLPKDLVTQFKNFKKINVYNCKNVIDIGANSGNWSLLFKSLFKNSNFFLIEADNFHLEKIKLVSRNYYIGALFSKIKNTYFFYSRKFGGTGNSLYKENSSIIFKKKNITTITLDKVLKIHFNKSKYDLIKLDTQGSELDILMGAKKTLKRTKMIICEIQIFRYSNNKVNYFEIFSFLNKYGFKLKSILNEYYKFNNLIHIDCLFIKK